MLVVIPCGGKKRKTASFVEAATLYTGSYFRACLRAALALTTPDRVRILSAKHGLLRLDEKIAPYDLRMGNGGAISHDRLDAQATGAGLREERDVVVLAGHDYARLALFVWPHAKVPLRGVGGLGFQLKRLREIAERKDLA